MQRKGITSAAEDAAMAAIGRGSRRRERRSSCREIGQIDHPCRSQEFTPPAHYCLFSCRFPIHHSRLTRPQVPEGPSNVRCDGREDIVVGLSLFASSSSSCFLCVQTTNAIRKADLNSTIYSYYYSNANLPVWHTRNRDVASSQLEITFVSSRPV